MSVLDNTLSIYIVSKSNLYHIDGKLEYNFVLFWYNMHVLCKLLLYNFYITGVYKLLYSAVHPMKYLRSDVMWYI